MASNVPSTVQYTIEPAWFKQRFDADSVVTYVYVSVLDLLGELNLGCTQLHSLNPLAKALSEHKDCHIVGSLH